MSVFNRTKKYRKTSQGIEEKLKLLEKEEKKNIQEIMTTDNMYSIVEPIPEVPPTPAVYTDVPDPNGVRDPAWTQPASGGDENDSATWENGWSDTDYLYNSNEVFGETGRPVLASPPNYTTGVRRFDPGAGLVRAYVGYGPSLGYIGAGNVFKGITYASYWGTMYAAVEENFGGQWTQKPYRAYYDDEKAFMINAYSKMVDMDNRGVALASIKMWHSYSYFWYGTWENVGGVKRDHPTYGKQVLINASLYTDAEKYESEPWKPHVPAWNKVLQQRELSSGNDPENFPGVIEVGGKLFKKSKQAMDKMLEESGQEVAFWGKGSTGGNYDKGFNPDHPDGTQQTNPFNPGTPLYNQFEKQRELQKMKDMGLIGYTGWGNDQVAMNLKNPMDFDGADASLHFDYQPGVRGEKGYFRGEVKSKGGTLGHIERGTKEDEYDKRNAGQDASDAVQHGLDNISSLGSLGAKDGDLVAFFGNSETPLQKTMKQSQLQYKRNMGKAYAAAESGDPAVEAEFEKTYGMSPQDYRRDGTFNPDGSPNLNSPVWQKLQSKKDSKKVIATSYDPDGHVIYEAEWMFDKDPLVKKSDAFGKKEGQKTWFKVKDIKPEYPKKKPPKLKNGWHPKSRWHEMSDRAKKIKVSSQDLIRNYKVSPTEVAEYHALVDIINKFIDDNPEKSKMIANRYPFSDPRLAELNFKLDRMMDASESYVDSKFPENKKVTSRIVKILKKNIELTDPETFKMDPTPPTQLDYNKLKLRESATRHFKKPVQLKSWHRGHLTNA